MPNTTSYLHNDPLSECTTLDTPHAYQLQKLCHSCEKMQALATHKQKGGLAVAFIKLLDFYCYRFELLDPNVFVELMMLATQHLAFDSSAVGYGKDFTARMFSIFRNTAMMAMTEEWMPSLKINCIYLQIS